MEDWRSEEDFEELASAPHDGAGVSSPSSGLGEEDDDLPPLLPELPLDDQDRVLLVLSYLGILALVPFLTARKEFVQWHARQGLLLFGVSITTLFAMILINVVLWHFHWVLGLLFLLLLLTSSFGVLALIVACILKAFEGERWRIPFLGDFVEKI
jgi:fumarate reductase subunit D